jgi:Tol biopolymer transport system component
MSRILISIGLCLCTLPTSVHAQQGPEASYDSAYYAWQAGDYLDGLERLERLLSGAGGEEFLERAALLTGELYRTEELAADGRAVRWSPDGRFAVYETGAEAETVTQIFAVGEEGARRLAEVNGHGLAFAPGGDRVAYLMVEETPELEAARAELRTSIEVRDYASYRRLRSELVWLDAEHSRVMLRELGTGEEHEVAAPGLGKSEVIFSPDGESLYVTGNEVGERDRTDIYELRPGSTPAAVTTGPGLKERPVFVLGGEALAYQVGGSLAVVDRAGRSTRTIAVRAPAISADGSTITYLSPDGDMTTLNVLSLSPGAEPAVVVRTAHRMASSVSSACASCPELRSYALSPDGNRVAYQLMTREDWELYLADVGGTGEVRLTHEIEHDLFPQFLDEERILGLAGEGRHRRAYLYDTRTGERTRVFHNNTVRTIAPQYEWAVSPDGSKILIVAERDGNTVSPERGVYLVDLERRVSLQDVLERVRANLAAERELRRRGQEMYAGVADAVRPAVADVSTARIYEYERELFRFGSKHVTQPGNAEAIEYLTERVRSFGYEPELQWFEPRPGLRSANVVAVLPGTLHPDVTYVVSSHFDSSTRGPGADDNTSGTVALLEAARVLAGRPQSATIEFAFLTGEEAGLLGSREYVRLAEEAGDEIVGVLNNDMVGFADDHRLDNTIRYSNAGIRDLQHAAAFLFTDLITHDAEYFRGTDAHSFYDAFGDVTGGIGSYPVLSSPHYHQVHDVLETINHQLVAEVSKTTVASVMLMASSPSRLRDLEVVSRDGSDLELRWAPALERDVVSYVVYSGPSLEELELASTVRVPGVTLSDVEPGAVVAIKAVNERRLGGWDWAWLRAE